MQERPRRYQRRGGIRTVGISVSFPLDLRDRLDDLAAREYTTFSALVVKAVAEYLDHNGVTAPTESREVIAAAV